MASRTGARPVGTDGMDFRHREKVAWQYQLSATNKFRLKVCIFIHLNLFAVLFVKLMEELLDIIGVDLPYGLDEVMDSHIPKPFIWEYLWLLSTPAAFCALLALPRNRSVLILAYFWGTLLFGLLPVILGIFQLLPDMMKYLETREADVKLIKLPLIVAWYIFFTIALQEHCFGLYFAKQLKNAWTVRTRHKIH